MTLLRIFTGFLKGRKQRAVLTVQYSFWNNVEARVPKVSLLRP